MSSDAATHLALGIGTIVGRVLARQGHLLERADQIGPKSSDYLWAASVVAAVERRTGLPTRWNRRLYRETNTSKGGRVAPDGRMSLSERAVFARVREAYTQRPVDSETALKAVRAVHNVAPEAAHSLGPTLGS